MANLQDRLDLDFQDISPTKNATVPRLNFEIFTDPNRYTVQLEQISPEITFTLPESSKQIQGPIPTAPIAQVEESIRQETEITLNVDLSRKELDVIEEHREGGDIEIKITLWIIGIVDDNRMEGRYELSETLIDGEWTRILDAFDYHDKRDVQLDLSAENPQIRDRLQTAHGKIEGAQRKHDTGDYPSAVTECRRAIETLQEIEETSEVLHERKYEELDDIMGKFESGFAGGLSHAEEKTNIDAALRRDSEFALNLTKACARYISVALEEENR